MKRLWLSLLMFVLLFTNSATLFANATAPQLGSPAPISSSSTIPLQPQFPMEYVGEFRLGLDGLLHPDPTSSEPLPEITPEGKYKIQPLNSTAYVGPRISLYRDVVGNSWEWTNGAWKWIERIANFLIVDDINTIKDPNSSLFDKTLATAGFIPVGKVVIKGGKLVYKLVSKNGKTIERAVENTPANRRAAGLADCNCFSAGTKVLTDEGEKNIEDIVVGDRVLSKDETTGEVAYKEVTATFNHETDEIYKIHLSGQTIESTFNHPFYVDGKGWTFVKDLKVGDLLVQSDGSTFKVDSVEVEHKQATVYNLRVDGFHTYFVSDLGIWVHNTNCWGKFSSDDLKKLAQADQKDIKRITGSAADAFSFFKEQVSNYKEVSTGVFVGKDANGVTFTYRAASKSGPPTIDVNGISGIRKIKFLEN